MKIAGSAKPLTLREWARLTVAEAVCGYMQRDGYHFCQNIRLIPEQGYCKWDPKEQADWVSWRGMMAVFEGVLDEIETAARETADVYRA